MRVFPKVEKVGKFYSEIILDKSSSMAGSKYKAACSSIEEELHQLRAKKEGETIVRITEFSGYWTDGVERCLSITGPLPIEQIKFKSAGAFGSTPLYATVGYILEDLLAVMQPQDVAIVKIFTDGEENASHSSKYAKASELKNLIKQAEEKGVIVTFIGTKFDTETVINNLGIHRGNTISHNNTPESIKATMRTSAVVTDQVRCSYFAGENVKGLMNLYEDKSEDENTNK